MYLPSSMEFTIAHLMHMSSSGLYARNYLACGTVYYHNVHTLNIKKLIRSNFYTDPICVNILL